jgi:hypothetical protein
MWTNSNVLHSIECRRYSALLKLVSESGDWLIHVNCCLYDNYCNSIIASVYNLDACNLESFCIRYD